MLILQIRHAETALADGRLDEAFELVHADQKLRSHRRGQSLMTKLVAAFETRGREHLAGERFSAALTDCEKAQQLGGDLPGLLALRSEAMDAMADQRRDERLRNGAVVAAREQIENGRLAAGERLLAVAEAGDTRAGQLLQELGARHGLVDSAVQSASDAIDRNDLDAALAEIDRARSANRSDKRLIELTDRVKRALQDRITAAINDGRLDLADSFGQRLGRIEEQSIDSQHLLSAIGQCHAAWDRIERGRVHEAEEICRRLTTIFPKANWLQSAAKQLSAAGEAVESLRAGPLGLLATSVGPRRDMPTQSPTVVTPPRDTGFQPVQTRNIAQPGLEARVTSEMSLPSKFIIQVDGAGSVLVVRQSVVTIGPISSSKMPDVGLVAEPGAPVMTIERMDEDYFIRGGVFAINDKPANDKLLASGDRISLTPRCRIGFLLPSAASTSASLDLIGARFPRADLRRVVLMDRDLVIGPGNSSHIRCDTTPEPIILHVRDSRLFCQTSADIQVDGRPMDRQRGIPIGAQVRAGLVSFVVTRTT